MKTGILEALLIDRVLGELAPDVIELLDVHLASDQTAAALAAELVETWHVARLIEAESEVVRHHQLPPFTERPPGWLVRHRGELLRLAACVVLGVGMGWSFTASQLGRQGMPPRSHGFLASHESVDVQSRDGASSFWSLTRLAAQYRRPPERHHTERYELQWDSPLRIQYLEDIQ